MAAKFRLKITEKLWHLVAVRGIEFVQYGRYSYLTRRAKRQLSPKTVSCHFGSPLAAYLPGQIQCKAERWSAQQLAVVSLLGADRASGRHFCVPGRHDLPRDQRCFTVGTGQKEADNVELQLLLLSRSPVLSSKLMGRYPQGGGGQSLNGSRVGCWWSTSTGASLPSLVYSASAPEYMVRLDYGPVRSGLRVQREGRVAILSSPTAGPERDVNELNVLGEQKNECTWNRIVDA
ncbi:hypothetical protein DFH07DRAFT_939201 [Mycena maculata]|nr:hypothetical protein DFH07DRAFT_939201 [Mycena maculata]